MSRPIFEGTQVIGYQSVRSKPERDVVQRAERLYAQLRAGKTNPFVGLLPRNLSFASKAMAVAVIVSLPARDRRVNGWKLDWLQG